MAKPRSFILTRDHYTIVEIILTFSELLLAARSGGVYCCLQGSMAFLLIFQTKLEETVGVYITSFANLSVILKLCIRNYFKLIVIGKMGHIELFPTASYPNPHG